MSSLGDGNNTVGGIECRAQLDSGSCYASAKLLDLLEKQPTEIKPKKIEMLMASATARMGIFKTTVSSRSGDYSLDVSLTTVNRGELLSLENPRYEQLLKTYSHLECGEMDGRDAKPLLPIHVILGTGLYARIVLGIRKNLSLNVPSLDGPFFPRERIGYTPCAPNPDQSTDYKELYRLDVLGLGRYTTTPQPCPTHPN